MDKHRFFPESYDLQKTEYWQVFWLARLYDTFPSGLSPDSG